MSGVTAYEPSLFDRRLLASELQAAQSALSTALDAISAWTVPTGLTDELFLEHALQDVRYHAHTVRTVQRLLEAAEE